ncbi:outer membrane beta-barrel protein [Spirosoma telluris]|uniref:outer membrane beta-barrel protein n=1 Tax=Spirosoma telluris TaxID=2183553 RepID=UPI0038CDBD2B
MNSAVYWRLTNNAIDYISTVDAAGISTTKPQNIAQRKAMGLNVNLSSQPVKNWNLNGGGDIRYVDLFSPALNQGNSGLVWSVNLNTSYKLATNYTFQANGNFSSGWISLQGTNTGFYWHSISAKREFMNKQASLTLGLNNPFNRGVNQTNRQSAPTFESEAHNYFIRRSVRLTFEWRFGQMNASGGKKGKKISNDDKDGR